MSMNDLVQALEIITKAEGADFEGPKPEELVRRAEEALGVCFPPTYRRFLLRLGCGDIAGREFYGVLGEDFENSSVPDGIWLTLTERRTSNLPESLVLVGATGDGGYYAIDLSQKSERNESPIIEWWPMGKSSIVSEDFGQFLHQRVSAG